MPIKVDVQIKIVKNNEDYVFTGTGTAQRDNDDSPDYGGIVYVYNEVHVILYTPYVGMHGGTSGSIAYTGTCLSLLNFEKYNAFLSVII